MPKKSKNKQNKALKESKHIKLLANQSNHGLKMLKAVLMDGSRSKKKLSNSEEELEKSKKIFMELDLVVLFGRNDPACDTLRKVEGWTGSLVIFDENKNKGVLDYYAYVLVQNGEVVDADAAEKEELMYEQILILQADAISLAERHTDVWLPSEEINLVLIKNSGEEKRLEAETLQWRIAKSVAKRPYGVLLPFEDMDTDLVGPSGEEVGVVSKRTKQRSLMLNDIMFVGLTLHAIAKQLIRREKNRDALDVLKRGEEAFSLSNDCITILNESIPILQIEKMWCYFMLGDTSWLSEAEMRLSKAREGIKGGVQVKECTRVRLVEGGHHPEIALHLRMELLEGVEAYHSGQFDKSKEALTSAQTRYFQLDTESRNRKRLSQAENATIEELMSIGFPRETVVAAVGAFGTKEGALTHQLSQSDPNLNVAAESDANAISSVSTLNNAGSDGLSAATDAVLDHDIEEGALSCLLSRLDPNLSVAADGNATSSVPMLNNAGSDGLNAATGAVLGHDIEEGALSHPLSQIDPNLTVAADGNAISSVPMPNNSGSDGSSAATDALLDHDIDVTKEGALSHPLSRLDPDLTVAADGNAISSAPMPNNAGSDGLGADTDAVLDYDIDVTKEVQAIDKYLALLSDLTD